MSRMRSGQHRERSLYCSHDSSRLQATNFSTQQEELHNSDTLSTEAQRDDMSSRAAPFSSSDLLYMPPSPPTLRHVAQAAASNQYTSLCDIPSLDLNSRRCAVDPAAHWGMPVTPTAPSKLAPHTSTPHYSQYPVGLLHALPDPIPRGPLRVVNGDATVPDNPSSSSVDGHSRMRPKRSARTRLTGPSAREKVDFTDAFAEKRDELKSGLAEMHAALSEKRNVDADLQNVTARLETALQVEKKQNSGEVASWCTKHYTYDMCVREAEKRGGCRYPLSQEVLEKQGEAQKKEQGKKRFRAMDKNSRRQTGPTWPVEVRSSTTTFIEDVSALRPEFLESTVSQAEPQTATLSDNRATGFVKGILKLASQPKMISPPVTQTTGQEREGEKVRSRLQGAMKLPAAQEEADQDAQWDNVDLSDDDEWFQVTADEGAEWEVVEE